MVVAHVPESATPLQPGHGSPHPLIDFMAFVRDVLAIEGVAKAYWVTEGGLADLWVLSTHEDSDAAEQIHLIKRDYRRRLGEFPINVRVLSLTRVSEESLPVPAMVFTPRSARQ